MNAALLPPFVTPMQTVRTTLALMFAPVEVVLLGMENLAQVRRRFFSFLAVTARLILCESKMLPALKHCCVFLVVK